MKFAEITNIWSVNLALLSRADQGRLFVERAKQLLQQSSQEAAKIPMTRGRIRRSWLVRKIGCRPAVPSQNPKLKALLLGYDAILCSSRAYDDISGRSADDVSSVSQDASPTRSFGPIAPVGDSGEPVSRNAPVAPDLGMIVGTGSTCRISGTHYSDIPTLIWRDGIDVAASDWFRHLVVDSDLAPSSAGQYAEVLRGFLRFCRRKRRDWKSVDDNFLLLWRKYMLDAKKVERTRVNYCLEVVFAFYQWAEETKRLRFQVGIYDRADLPDRADDFSFPISAKRVFSKSVRGRVFGIWTTPLKLRGVKQSVGRRNTPTEQQARQLHEIALESNQGERNSLMLSWAEETGARRFEMLQICTTQMPSLDELEALIEKDGVWPIEVRRKGGQVKSLVALPDLLVRTIDYIHSARAKIISQCHKTEIGYSEPPHVFLSSTIGQPLHPDSVTSLGGRLFRKAGIRKANIHRLRAKFAVQTVEAFIDALSVDGTPLSNETILIQAGERMGINPDSLRPYLNFALSRRLRSSDAVKALDLQSRIRQLELTEATIVHRLAAQSALQEAARLISAGQSTAAAQLLTEAITRLKTEGLPVS